MNRRLSQQDNIYFSADWRNKHSYQIKTEAQVKRTQWQRAIMLANPDIVGKLIVLRNSNDQPRIGIVKSAEIDAFDAIVANARGAHYPADALLWVIGDWQGVDAVDGGHRAQLSALLKTARSHMDAIIPFPVRKALVEADVPVLPETLLPEDEEMPDGVDRTTALVSIVLALAKDGAILTENGIQPQRARENEPLEQNEARELAMSLFPDEARLRKVGIDVHRRRLLLYFDFPQAAERNFDDKIEELIELSGWDTRVKPQVNQQALAIALDDLLPEGAHISKGPSFYMDKREVQVEIANINDEQEAELRQNFLHETDFRLMTTQRKEVQVQEVVAVATGEKLEINQAYAVVRQKMEPLGLYKVGLKQGQLVLSFISPQLGERHRDAINELAEITGYTLTVHPHPNQQKIMEVARKLASNAGWNVQKGPSIYVDRGVASLKLSGDVNEAEIARVAEEFCEQTGYELEVDA